MKTVVDPALPLSFCNSLGSALFHVLTPYSDSMPTSDQEVDIPGIIPKYDNISRQKESHYFHFIFGKNKEAFPRCPQNAVIHVALT